MSEPKVIQVEKAPHVGNLPMVPASTRRKDLPASSGMQVVRITQLKKYREIGRLLDDVGATELARGMFLLNLGTTEAAIGRLAKMSKKKGADRTESLKVLQTLTTLLQHHSSLAEKISAGMKRQEAPQPPGVITPSLPPPGAVVNVGVLFQNQGGKKENDESVLLPQVRVDCPAPDQRQGGQV